MNKPVTTCQHIPQSRSYYEFNKCGKPATQRKVGTLFASGREFRYADSPDPWTRRQHKDDVYCDRHVRLIQSGEARRKYNYDIIIFEPFDATTALAEWQVADAAEKAAAEAKALYEKVVAAFNVIVENIGVTVDMSNRFDEWAAQYTEEK